jgi:predicted transcriptional regulator of viral defense system
MLLAGPVDQKDMARQLSRWVKSGDLIQLRRTVYAMAPKHRKTRLHPFSAIGFLRGASYISLQSALEFYNLIPEAVSNITAVTTGRPEKISTPLGVYIFRHMKKALFFGFRSTDLGDEQTAMMALPEKALLDLLYLTPDSDDEGYLSELRLQNTESLNFELLGDMAEGMKSKKVQSAVQSLERMIRRE